ncbi:MAG: ABC transporter ATP-binding protein [Euryarchaeota archaeon]|nr:ABC transporter ATP-binding protein [Euryarchaeota archaeon]
MKKETIMKIRSLTKMYGKQRGILDLDLDLYKGEILGYLGPNGAGKTTTIRTGLGLLSKTEGEITIFGMDSHEDSTKIRQRVGYLPGDFGLFSGLKASTVLHYLLSLSGVKSDKKMKELAERLELDLSRKTGDLSKGNRQKVGLVQALMADQDLIILDEPTAGLDPLMQQEVYRILQEEKEKGKTIFMSSHILAEVEEVCDRVAIIRKGRLQVIEEIAALQDKLGKTLSVEFRNPVDSAEFEMDGVNNITVDGTTLSCVITENLDELVKQISTHKIVNMSLKTFPLEQLFLKYYTDGDDQ